MTFRFFSISDSFGYWISNDLSRTYKWHAGVVLRWNMLTPSAPTRPALSTFRLRDQISWKIQQCLNRPGQSMIVWTSIFFFFLQLLTILNYFNSLDEKSMLLISAGRVFVFFYSDNEPFTFQGYFHQLINFSTIFLWSCSKWKVMFRKLRILYISFPSFTRENLQFSFNLATARDRFVKFYATIAISNV